MKLLLGAFSMAWLLLISCNKPSLSGSAARKALPSDNGCIEQKIVPRTAHSVDPSALPVIEQLFAFNRIDNSHLRYYAYDHDTVQTYFPPYAPFDEKAVRVDQYVNGLRIFNADMVYLFKNDTLNYVGGSSIKSASLDPIPQLTLPQVRGLFVQDMKTFEPNDSSWKEGCLQAEFGYYNLNAGTSYAPMQLVKGWKVTLKAGTFPSEYPQAVYQDADGKRCYFDDGIRTFGK
jgi:hypothetical protein